MSKPTDLVQGTLDLLILKTLTQGPMHGWSIAQEIKSRSEEILQVQQGSLYPALHKLETQGFIDAEWGDSENNRKAKFYALTRKGRQYLKQEEVNWERLSRAINLIVKMA
jgi:PadR family transcriptional regulator, regulatory protein PadR